MTDFFEQRTSPLEVSISLFNVMVTLCFKPADFIDFSPIRISFTLAF